MADRKTRPQLRFSVYEKEHPSKNTDRAFNSLVPKASKNKGENSSPSATREATEEALQLGRALTRPSCTNDQSEALSGP